MGRRRRTDNFDQFRELLTLTPWLVGPILALGVMVRGSLQGEGTPFRITTALHVEGDDALGCPQCKRKMLLRMARREVGSGQEFRRVLGLPQVQRHSAPLTLKCRAA
jgi:hypothetical protein